MQIDVTTYATPAHCFAVRTNTHDPRCALLILTTMSLKGLAKRFHRSRSTKDNASSGDQDNDEATSSSRSTPSRTGTPGPPASEVALVQMPTPEPAEPVSMPIPEHTPASPPEPEVLPHSMDGALADLAPMQAQLDAGPAVKKIDKALDTIGTSLYLSAYSLPAKTRTSISGSVHARPVTRPTPFVRFLPRLASTRIQPDGLSFGPARCSRPHFYPPPSHCVEINFSFA